MNKKPWPITTAFGIRKRIDTNPDYQRPAVWSKQQKQLLIDTILRGYDIPKLYWRQISKQPNKYEVVDGQQRLRAIWEFMEGRFSLPADKDPINGCDVSGNYYNGDGGNILPDEIRQDFDIYSLDIIIISESNEEEVREMFLRLQNGTTLKAQEKRNAMPGNMRDYIKNLVTHPIFTSVAFNNSRYTHDLVAAQMVQLEMEGGPTNVKNADLNNLYIDHKCFDRSCGKAKKVKRVLNFLFDCFPTKTPELNRYSTLTLFTLISHLIDKYDIDSLQREINEWFISFEAYRRNEKLKDIEHCNPEIVSYQEKTSHSTDSHESIAYRHDYLLRKLFEHLPNINQKDDQRIFTHEQRMAIFRKDGGVCQIGTMCDNVKCDWDNWDADHIIPWSKGGTTTVQNGQVACSSCNRSKGANNLE